MTDVPVWAPDAARVRLRLAGDADHEMAPRRDGWWRSRCPAPARAPTTPSSSTTTRAAARPPVGLAAGRRARAEPRYDHDAFAWTDQGWTGRQLPGSVLYELHVGTFTPEGTFDAAIDRLDHLVGLGVDLVELLPVNAFNGEHNWGYDGVCWYAPHEPYGGPDGLQAVRRRRHASAAWR